jgi:hypothetical protein
MRRPQQPNHAIVQRATSEIVKAKDTHPEKGQRQGRVRMGQRRGLSPCPISRLRDRGRFSVRAGPLSSKPAPAGARHQAGGTECVISPAHFARAPDRHPDGPRPWARSAQRIERAAQRAAPTIMVTEERQSQLLNRSEKSVGFTAHIVADSGSMFGQFLRVNFHRNDHPIFYGIRCEIFNITKREISRTEYRAIRRLSGRANRQNARAYPDTGKLSKHTIPQCQHKHRASLQIAFGPLSAWHRLDQTLA